MIRKPATAASSVLLVGLAIVSASCIDLSKEAVCPAPTGEGAVKVCTAGYRTVDDGLFDDFEDGDSQVTKIADRAGYWFTSHDPNGSTIDPSPLKMSEGGVGDSKKALHVFGHTSSDSSAWGVLLGTGFVEHGVYDASDYAAVTFKAKVVGNSTTKIRFSIADVNTHPDGGVCKSCWNHFGKDMEFTSDWRDYTVSFAEAKQESGWGDRFGALTPSKLIALNWAVKQTGKDFDLWIDDVQLVACK
jgi:hypothetical protein